MPVSTASPLDVFISSTCFDLVDLRAEQKASLEQSGMIVRVSDDPSSAFYVDPTDDSIASCLTNVEASQVVVCIIDRRYGGVMKAGPFKGKSATHAEIETARAAEKPIFFFVREAAWNDYQLLRRDAAQKTRWVEPDDDDQRALWTSFMNEIAKLPKHENWSNWCDLFRTSADLRPLILKRLIEAFPQRVASLAMRPERLLRVVLRVGTFGGNFIRARILNVGTGPALNIRHGASPGTGGGPVDPSNAEIVQDVGGMCEGDVLTNGTPGEWVYTLPPNFNIRGSWTLYCQYENRFEDRYAVELPVDWHPEEGKHKVGSERLWVLAGGPDGGQWVRVH